VRQIVAGEKIKRVGPAHKRCAHATVCRLHASWAVIGWA